MTDQDSSLPMINNRYFNETTDPHFRTKSIQPHKSVIMTNAQEKTVAESAFKAIFNQQTKTLTAQGESLCAELKIEQDKIIPKKLEQFKEEIADLDIAKMHWKHHQKRRQKHLIRISNLMEENYASSIRYNSVDADQRLMLTEIQPRKVVNSAIFNLMHQSSLASLSRIASSGQLHPHKGLDFEQKTKKSLERIHEIEEIRKRKEKKAQKNLADLQEERNYLVQKKNEKNTEHVMKKKHQRQELDKAAIVKWKEELKEAEERVQKRKISPEQVTQKAVYSNGSDYKSQRSVTSNRHPYQNDEDSYVEQSLKSIEKKLQQHDSRAKFFKEQTQMRAAQINQKLDVMRFNTAVPSLENQKKLVSPQIAKVEQYKLEQYAKIFERKKKQDLFIREKKEEQEFKVYANLEKEQKIKEEIKKQKHNYKDWIKKVEVSAKEKEERHVLLRENQDTMSIKQILIKRESMKLRMEEVGEFKVIVEQERFREKQKILGKHKQMEDQLNQKKKSVERREKQQEIDRKSQKILEWHEQQLQSEKEKEIRKLVNKLPLKSDLIKLEAEKAKNR